MKLEDALELLGDTGEVPVSFPQFDSAILGVAERFGMGPVICYDKNKVMQILRESFSITEADLDESDIADGLTLEDKKQDMAQEWYDYNTIGAWIGEYTPVFVEI